MDLSLLSPILLWSTLWWILRPSRRSGRGWCPECSAPDLWIVSRDTPITWTLGVCAIALAGAATLAGLPSVAALAGIAAAAARFLRPEQRRCESCDYAP